jgi:predicted aspartyl protease
MQHAFTTKYNGYSRVLFTKVGVSQPITPEEASTQHTEVKEYIAIWDTGATHSAITKKVADELSLQPTGMREVRSAEGKSDRNTYLVNIGLPNKVMVGQIRVTEVNLIPDDNTSDDKQPNLLIGMDIIGMGDFAVTNQDGKTTMSFRLPSSTQIDFVPESVKNNVMEGGNRKARLALKAKERKGLL